MSTVKIKYLALSAPPIISALFLGYELFLFNQSINLKSLILLLISIILFLAFFILQALIIKNIYALGGLCVLETLGMLVPFYAQISVLLAAIVIIASLLLIKAAWGGQQFLKNSIKMHFNPAAKQVAAQASMALILFGVISYINAITFQDLIRALLQSSESLIQNLLSSLLPNIDIATNISLEVQNFLLVKLSGLSEGIRKLALAGLAVSIFLSVRAIFVLINWIAVLFSLGIYKILLATQFIYLSSKKIDKETITLESGGGGVDKLVRL